MAVATIDMMRASGTQLAQGIRAGELSSREVVDAHIATIERVNPKINAVVHPIFERAREQADEADARIAQAGSADELPSLLGVPFTVKESFAVAGMPNCSGLVARRDVLAESTAPAAQRLLDAGAILLGLTNTSELTLWIESVNRVYGRTSNPYDHGRTAGGSSGGEGAIVGAGGSPFGIGSDLAGSIRIPAFFNGVFGHKPGPGIVPNTGMYPYGGIDSMRLVGTGPITRRAEDLMPLLRLMAGPDGSDLLVAEPALGDPETVALAGMRVLLPQKAWLGRVEGELLDARDRAAGVLEAAGAELLTEPMRNLRRAWDLFLTALAESSEVPTRELIRVAGADAPRLRGARKGPHTAAFWMLLLGESLAKVSPRPIVRRQLAAGRALARELADTIGDGVLLFPPHRGVAPRHNGTVGRPWTIAPTALFNLAGLPVTQVPLGLGGGGLPLGVQVAAGPGRDHVAIAAAIELERVCGGWVPPGL